MDCTTVASVQESSHTFFDECVFDQMQCPHCYTVVLQDGTRQEFSQCPDGTCVPDINLCACADSTVRCEDSVQTANQLPTCASSPWECPCPLWSNGVSPDIRCPETGTCNTEAACVGTS